ncbi:acetyltransferase [Gordonia westfalica]|uniref:Acetyltransferase n=1 Tax=Gordonia westfalica TaxID=158898 RepID=A0ABU2GRL1_9ACTN|nr:acetyltransferase [Gordonia westfalica]MDS1114097.1 acetyltransferase [Gordonia westfalica]
MISAVEYAVVNLGAIATLRASTPQLDFLAHHSWYDLDVDSAHRSMASRVLLRSESPEPDFTSNLVIQHFSLGRTEVVRLSELDTTLDIAALGDAVVLNHAVDLNGYLCVDDGTYRADGFQLFVRRSQLAYASADGKSMLSILTATTPEQTWMTTNSEITEMEGRWLQTITNTTSGASQGPTSPESSRCSSPTRY